MNSYSQSYCATTLTTIHIKVAYCSVVGSHRLRLCEFMWVDTIALRLPACQQQLRIHKLISISNNRWLMCFTQGEQRLWNTITHRGMTMKNTAAVPLVWMELHSFILYINTLFLSQKWCTAGRKRDQNFAIFIPTMHVYFLPFRSHSSFLVSAVYLWPRKIVVLPSAADPSPKNKIF